MALERVPHTPVAFLHNARCRSSVECRRDGGRLLLDEMTTHGCSHPQVFHHLWLHINFTDTSVWGGVSGLGCLSGHGNLDKNKAENSRMRLEERIFFFFWGGGGGVRTDGSWIHLWIVIDAVASYPRVDSQRQEPP